MAVATKRETIIALKARKQGFLVASEVQHPELIVPEFHHEPLDVECPEQYSLPVPPPVKGYPPLLSAIALALLIMVFAAGFACLLMVTAMY